jgi:hypothetical protein
VAQDAQAGKVAAPACSLRLGSTALPKGPFPVPPWARFWSGSQPERQVALATLSQIFFAAALVLSSTWDGFKYSKNLPLPIEKKS